MSARRFNIAAVATVTTVLALSVLVAAQYGYQVVTTTTYYNYSSAYGYYLGKSERTTTTQRSGPNQSDHFGITRIDGGRWMCRPGTAGGTGPCVPCESCHSADVKPMTIAAYPESLLRHESTYFPRAELRLGPEQKLLWGTGLHLILRSRDIVLYTQSGNEIAVFPPGTRILKNARGEPFAMQLPSAGEPRMANQPR